MKVEPGRPVAKSEIQSTDLYCGICATDFAQPLDLVRNIDGLAVHLECMRRGRIRNLKEQLAAKQNELGAAVQVGNSTVDSLLSEAFGKQPISTMVMSSTKRKWDEYAGKENQYPKLQLPSEQHVLGTRVGVGQGLSPPGNALRNSGLHKQPELDWAAPLSKRKWEEPTGKEGQGLKKQPAPRHDIPATRPAGDRAGNATASLLQKSRLPEHSQPGSAVKFEGWAKRQWKEDNGEEVGSGYPHLETSSDASPISKAKLGLHIIEISSSDEGSPPKAAPQTRMSGNRDQEQGPSLSNHPEKYSLGPSGLDPVVSALSTEDLPPTLTQKTVIDPPLCEEQQRLVNTIMTGRNVFYTGSAGCGKSTVLKNFVKRLKAQLVWKGGERKEPKQVDIIAPTGRAALDINGSTSWTYAGWNPDSMKKPLEKLKDAAEHGKWIRKRLRATDVLVVDEISMMENHHLERLNEIMQSARGNTRAFGGVQLVVTGDFCQLPPVKPFAYCYKCGKGLSKSKADTVFTCPNGHGSWHDSDKWAFCSSAWKAAAFEHVNLTTIHRQNDRVFIEILQKCRLGVPFTPQEEDLLLQHDSQTGNAVRLFSTRQEVGAVNREAFNHLKSSQRTYNSYDDFRCYNSNLESKGRRSDHDGTLDALRDHRFDPRIDLKQGMVVVLLVNLDQENGLVNGSQGVVMGFEKAEDSKMPEAIRKDEKEFSRLGSGPVLTGEHAEVREANIRIFMEHAKEKVWPIVLFQNRVTRTIYADCRVTELGDEAPYSLISRTQIPLVAGWAMTVHKSQGMTLSRVVVNLSKSFEEGQMYVALSRARSLEGLKVEGLGKQLGCNERVRRFLREMLGVVEMA